MTFEVRTPGPSLAVHCFGGFRLWLHEREPHLTGVRPRVRTLLRFLALHAGRPVHRERIIAALWPDLRPEAAVRNLQVAVSTLRGVLEPDLPRGASRLIPRAGETYLLTLPADGTSDLHEFDRAAQAGRHAWTADRPEAARESLRAALALYTGDLLPEDGPADWVVGMRECYRLTAAEAAGMLAEIELASDRPEAAVDAARRSLAIDRFRDASWRVLMAASEEAGNAASAERARQAYHRVLRSLDSPALPPPRRPAPVRDHGLRKNSTSPSASRRPRPVP